MGQDIWATWSQSLGQGRAGRPATCQWRPRGRCHTSGRDLGMSNDGGPTMNPVPVLAGLINWAKARQVVWFAIPCLLGWLALASLWENRDILSTVLQALGALRAPGRGVAHTIVRWFHTAGVEPIFAASLPAIVGALFVLGGTRGAPLGGAKARGSALAWCVLVPAMIVLGSAQAARLVAEWWLAASVVLVVGCRVVEPFLSPDSDRDLPAGLEALVQEPIVAIVQAFAVLFLPVLVVGGMMVDSVAPEVRLDRPMATGAVPIPANGSKDGSADASFVTRRHPQPPKGIGPAGGDRRCDPVLGQ